MEVTEIRIHLRNEARLKAFATVTFDGAFVVHNMKVVNGNNGLIVCMPSRKIKDGTYKDIAHPIDNEFRNKLETIILKAYKEEMAKVGVSADENRQSAAGAQRADGVAH
ncbi:MAG TPA: septation protein SpoVG [Elusimicrobia bacterium]|nr:septation protein SpoVG [Elusimicrobiota bacterium]